MGLFHNIKAFSKNKLDHLILIIKVPIQEFFEKVKTRFM